MNHRIQHHYVFDHSRHLKLEIQAMHVLPPRLDGLCTRCHKFGGWMMQDQYGERFCWQCGYVTYRA